jgi:hypothetical protein
MYSYWQDDNRYSATRGAHLNLKRAEKARLLVNKIPGMFLKLFLHGNCIKLHAVLVAYTASKFTLHASYMICDGKSMIVLT